MHRKALKESLESCSAAVKLETKKHCLLSRTSFPIPVPTLRKLVRAAGLGCIAEISIGVVPPVPEYTVARLVHRGYAVHGINHEGHGKSSGSKGYLSSFGDVVRDCSDNFKSVCEKQENRLKKRFLYGFSMRGTVVLQLHRKDPLYWDGAVLLAPMCKIRSNPYMYRGNLALQTGRELLSVSLDTEKNLHEVSLPFLVLHGTDDVVADPSGSRLLHERASSRDKTLKLYPGMWHVLMGERPEDVERVFADVISWLEDRVGVSHDDVVLHIDVSHDLEDASSSTVTLTQDLVGIL
uniref:Serine aminopeptidase S33 domain-containing protein n=1 Tax=Zea mays TaxID=4577 RepID=A0A804UI62_MAIZE